MTLAFVVHFFDFRNDVRALLTELAQLHHIVLLVRPEDEAQIRAMAPPSAQVRLVRERSSTPVNTLADQLFHQFGRLPKSRQNYYLMEIFKISLNPDPTARRRAMARLTWRMRLPAFISYDTYLGLLSYSRQTDLSGIDAFFCFTDIADSYLLARLLREKLPTYVYVYSWDHPCKHIRYSKQVQYLVWNQGMAQDLEQLQGIAPAQIQQLGASQFGYIDKFTNAQTLAQAPRRFPFQYVYVGCAIGLPGLVEQELAVVAQLAQALALAAPTWRLVVRPYPVLRSWAPYQALRALPNVVVDDGFRTGQNLAVGDAQIQEKFQTIAHAELFLHLGTTLGLEACFTDTPSFLIDFDTFAQDKNTKSLAIWPFVHQYQNDKYLAHPPGANRITSPAHFKQVVNKVATEGKATFLPFNYSARQAFPVRSFANLAQQLSTLVAIK